MRATKSTTLSMLVCVIGLFGPPPAKGADFPNQPVRLIVGFGTGSGTDRIARLVATELSKIWGQRVIVENKVGAAARIAEHYVALAKPDGYTIQLNGSQRTIYAANAIVSPDSKVNYDIVNGFTPITLISRQPQVIAVSTAKYPDISLSELIALAKEKPRKLYYGQSGEGSAQDLSVKYLMQMTSTSMVGIPYTSTAQILMALVRDEVDIVLGAADNVAPLVQSGAIRVIGIADDAPSLLFPGVPTVVEQLKVPNYTTLNWFGLFGPAGMPQDLLEKLNADAVKAIRSPEVNGTMSKVGYQVIANSPAEFGAFIKGETDRWVKVISSVRRN